MSEGREVGDGVRTALIGPNHQALASRCKDFDFHPELGVSHWKVVSSGVMRTDFVFRRITLVAI